jgi:hypothetical protein
VVRVQSTCPICVTAAPCVLLQELQVTRAACTEGDLLLQEAEGRVGAAQSAAAGTQAQALQVCVACRDLVEHTTHRTWPPLPSSLL